MGAVLLLLAALVAIDVVAERSRRVFDLTEDKTLTLSPETEAVVDRVGRPVEVSVFLDRSDPARVNAPVLLSRYRRMNRRISFRVLSPADAPAEAQRLGVDPVRGGVALVSGDRVELAQTAIEQDVTAGLARLLRPAAVEICLSSGHGEADSASSLADGLQTAARTLAANGYRLRPVDLLTGTTVPASCASLVVANPTAPLGDGATAAVRSYLDAGGRAVVLADPASSVDLRALLDPYDLGLRRGLVLEADAGGRFSDDPFRPVVRNYRSPNPIVRRLAPTFFPGVQGVRADEETQTSGLSVSVLAVTSDASYLETAPVSPSFDPDADAPGPIAVAAAADLSANVGGDVRRTRIVLVGDVDFATNAFIGEAANSDLLVRSIDWVSTEEDLVTVSANIGRLRPLRLTEDRLRYLRFVASIVIPGLFLLLGGVVWAVRRGR